MPSERRAAGTRAGPVRRAGARAPGAGARGAGGLRPLRGAAPAQDLRPRRGKRVRSVRNMVLSEEQGRQFIDDGFIVCRGLLPPGLVETTRERLLAAMQID